MAEKRKKISYSLPFNIENDRFVEGKTVIADKSISAFVGDNQLRSFLMEDITEFRCVADVGGGRFTITEKGEEHILCRFTEKYLGDYASLAKRLNKKEKGLPPAPPKKTKKTTTFKRVVNLCKPFALGLTGAGSVMILSSICTVFYQSVQKELIDRYLLFEEGSFAEALPILTVMLALLLVVVACTVAKNILCTLLGAKMSHSLRVRVFNKIQSLSMSYINKMKPGTIINRASADTEKVREFMQHTFGNAMSALFTLAVAIVAMFIISWKLTLIAVVTAPLALVFIRLFQRNMRTIFSAQFRKGDKIKSKLQDVISGIRVVKVFGREKAESDDFYFLANEYAVTQSKNEVFWALFFPFVTLFMGLGGNLIYYFGGADVLNNQMSVGTLVQFVAYSTMLFGPLRQMARLPQMIVAMLTSVNRLYEILDEEPEIIYPENDNKIADGNIEFKNVSFGYERAHEVLSDLSFKINKGEMVGIVGRSGVGKTTCINLIMRLYDATEGQILIDGRDIRSYSAEALHLSLGAVLQETFLFSGSILDNLRYARPSTSYFDIIEASKKANAHDFIMSLPDGYNTYIGERGYNLSGGERQRVAIARALLCDPKILILDEATSSLDTKNEMLIQQALSNLCKGRTTVAIAHRLSTLRNADRIIVLDKGTLFEEGSHSELMKKKGIYHSLVTAQSVLHKVKE